jgi:carboxypeptidase Q
LRLKYVIQFLRLTSLRQEKNQMPCVFTTRRVSTASAVLAGAVVLFSAQTAAKDSFEEATRTALVKIAGEGLVESHTLEYLTQLSDDVGARVTGSPQSQKAVDWSLAKMRAMGLENVHAEKFQIWRGWTRGSASGELTEPMHRKLNVDAMGWTGSTAPAGAEGEVVTANVFDLDNEMKNPARFSGKIILVVVKGQPRKSLMAMFAQFGDFAKLAGKNGAMAIIGGQGGFKSEGMNLTHTGILGFEADFTIPIVSLTAEDQSQMERFLDSGKKVRARLNVQNSFSNGPVETANALGEIRGREHPEEILVVGAHLDSWDLSEGATDNGMGSVSVLGAAEAILRSGQRPRRTIRFVLFNGEEQGLLGSFAYVKQHQSEMANHLGDLVLDEGQGPVKEFQLGGHDDLIAAFQSFADSLANIRPIKVNDKVEFGTDTGPFIMAGLPGINMDQDSPEYKYTHHSAADALEAVKPEILAQDATIMAMTAYWIADRTERLAKPWPAKKTATMLREQRQYEFLKAFNLWPFGDMGAEEKQNQESQQP